MTDPDIYLDYSTPVGGLWCERCAASSAAEAEWLAISPYGVRRTGVRIWLCIQCQDHRVLRNVKPCR